MQAVLIGVPLDLGAQNLGVDVGPDAFRYQKIAQKLTGSGIEITDKGDLPCPARETLEPGNPKLRFLDEIVRMSEETAKISKEAIKNGQKLIALGGDHSIDLGVVAGASVALESDLGLVYLDAHGDMNTDETTLTGNIHGMHLASLMGLGAPELAHVYGQQPKIAKDHLLHIGGSDFDQAELDLIEREKLQAFTMLDLLSSGLGPLLKMIDDLKTKVNNVWVSLDLDVIDMVYAPGAGMPNKRGLTYREIAAIAEYVGQNCNVVGIDVVEYNPLQDIDHKTAELGIELIAKFLGTDYSWYTSTYMAQNKVS
ncbi:MAG TPA: arginase [Candidatus Saccharimonadales bacterium]|nr:arginase [Candidatus Saccharimonadales bacterium]